MRLSLRRGPLMLRWPVGMRILPGAKRRNRHTRGNRQHLHTELDFPAPHFLLCSPTSLLQFLTSAAVAALPHRHLLAPAEDPSAAQNSATSRDLPAPANPASSPGRHSEYSA